MSTQSSGGPAERIRELILMNLFGVFNERDPERRGQAISRNYTEDAWDRAVYSGVAINTPSAAAIARRGRATAGSAGSTSRSASYGPRGFDTRGIVDEVDRRRAISDPRERGEETARHGFAARADGRLPLRA